MFSSIIDVYTIYYGYNRECKIDRTDKLKQLDDQISKMKKKKTDKIGLHIVYKTVYKTHSLEFFKCTHTHAL